jgi:hypothetical protein
MKVVILFFGLLGILFPAIGLGIHIYTIIQVWGSGFWQTALTAICIGLSSMYWAYQWWHGFGWNFSSLVLIFMSTYAVYLIIDKILAAALGIDEE